MLTMKRVPRINKSCLTIEVTIIYPLLQYGLIKHTLISRVDADSISSIVDADASYSKKLGTVCGVLTADCLPIFICNKEGTAVGIAHAGWRGLVGGIIESLIESFDCNGEDLIVHLGPAISQLSFEVGGEVKSQYLSKNENFMSCFNFIK